MQFNWKRWLLFNFFMAILFIILCIGLWATQDSPQYMKDAAMAIMGGLVGGMVYDMLKTTFGQNQSSP